jgi:30S ribosomal protein S31
MGRGDKRTRKGKIFSGSFGNSRPHKAVKSTVVAEATEDVAKKKPAAKKAVAEEGEKKTAKRAPAKKAEAKPE